MFIPGKQPLKSQWLCPTPGLGGSFENQKPHNHIPASVTGGTGTDGSSAQASAAETRYSGSWLAAENLRAHGCSLFDRIAAHSAHSRRCWRQSAARSARPGAALLIAAGSKVTKKPKKKLAKKTSVVALRSYHRFLGI